MTLRQLADEAARDLSVRLVLETEGARGAAERGWLGRAARKREEQRQLNERLDQEDD